MPGWFTGLRIAQLILSLAVVALNAYHLHYIRYYVYFYSIAVVCIPPFSPPHPAKNPQASATVITSTYHLAAILASPRTYNGWAILCLDILMLILWLASFAVTANLARTWTSDACYDPYIGYFTCYRRTKRDATTTVAQYWSTMVAVATVCAVQSSVPPSPLRLSHRLTQKRSFLFLATLLAHSTRLLHRAPTPRAYPDPPPPPPVYASPPSIPLDTKLGGYPVAAAIPAQQRHQQQTPYQLSTPQPQPFYNNNSPYRPSASPLPSQQSLISASSGGRRSGSKQARYYQRPTTAEEGPQ